MKVNEDNAKKIEYFSSTQRSLETCRLLLSSLVIDLKDVNETLVKLFGDKLFIDYKEEHTEYSPERVDPCSDYYGYFYLCWENTPYETVGGELTIDDLDTVLCAIYDLRLKKIING